MEFSYMPVPVTIKPWEIDLKQLRHPYYAQLSPDGEHLVPGMLHQGRPPAIGKWLQVGTIIQPLAERYFVQQTSFNTLVPGLLIQTDERPGANWKDVRKLSVNFHLIWFSSTPYVALEPPSEFTIVDSDELLTEIINPALNTIYPERNPSIHFVFQFFYLYNLEEMINDPANLIKFSGTTPLRLRDVNTSSYVDNMNGVFGADHEITIQPDAEDGYYSVVLGVEDPTTHEITDYILIKDLIEKRLPA